MTGSFLLAWFFRLSHKCTMSSLENSQLLILTTMTFNESPAWRSETQSSLSLSGQTSAWTWSCQQVESLINNPAWRWYYVIEIEIFLWKSNPLKSIKNRCVCHSTSLGKHFGIDFESISQTIWKLLKKMQMFLYKLQILSWKYSLKTKVQHKSSQNMCVSFNQYRKTFLHWIWVNGSNDLEAIENNGRCFHKKCGPVASFSMSPQVPGPLCFKITYQTHSCVIDLDTAELLSLASVLLGPKSLSPTEYHKSLSNCWQHT